MQIELRRGASEGRGSATADVDETRVGTSGATPQTRGNFSAVANHTLCTRLEFQ